MADIGPGMPLVRSSGGAGCLAMWQWTHSAESAAMNGSAPAEHLVERDTQGVEITPEIDPPVHAAGLFGRHISECPGNHLGRRGCRSPGMTLEELDQRIENRRR